MLQSLNIWVNWITKQLRARVVGVGVVTHIRGGSARSGLHQQSMELAHRNDPFSVEAIENPQRTIEAIEAIERHSSGQRHNVSIQTHLPSMDLYKDPYVFCRRRSMQACYHPMQ